MNAFPRRPLRVALALVVGIALLLAAAALLLVEAPWLLGIGTATTEDLDTVSHRLATRLPVMIDAQTRLERAEAGTGLEQVFHFTLVQQDAAALAASGAAVRLRDAMRERICSDSTFAPLVARGVTTTYVYNDRSGVEAMRYSVRPHDCLWRKFSRAVGI